MQISPHWSLPKCSSLCIQLTCEPLKGRATSKRLPCLEASRVIKHAAFNHLPKVPDASGWNGIFQSVEDLANAPNTRNKEPPPLANKTNPQKQGKTKQKATFFIGRPDYLPHVLAGMLVNTPPTFLPVWLCSLPFSVSAHENHSPEQWTGSFCSQPFYIWKQLHVHREVPKVKK